MAMEEEYRSMTVTLNESEKAAAKAVGNLHHRQTRGNNHGKGRSADVKDGDDKNDVRGTSCEFAVSKALNLWGGFADRSHNPDPNSKKDIDVGGMIEVRSCENMDLRHMIKPEDLLLPMVCVVCHREKEGIYYLAGWMDVEHAHRNYEPIIYPSVDDPTKMRDPIYYIPLNELWPMSHLVQRVWRARGSDMMRGSDKLHGQSIVAQWQRFNNLFVPSKHVEVQISLF